MNPFIEDCEIPPQPCSRKRVNVTIERNVVSEGNKEFFVLRDTSSIVRFRQPLIEDHHQYQWQVTLCEGVYSLIMKMSKREWDRDSFVIFKDKNTVITEYSKQDRHCSMFNGLCVRSFILESYDCLLYIY